MPGLSTQEFRTAGNRRNCGERGFIIVAVLWILAALATLASIYSIYVSNTAVASHLTDDRLAADAALRSALELTALQLTSRPTDKRPASGAFEERVGRAKIAVRYVSEGARIDLNAAPKPVLAGLMIVLGASVSDAAYAADRIIGWRKKGEVAGQNQEVAAYKEAGMPYMPRQAPFSNTLELSLVLGLSVELVEKMRPFVTVFNGQAGIDAANAAPEVIAALPGMTPELLSTVLDARRRDPADATAITEAMGPARKLAALETRKSLRVFIEAELESGRRLRAEIVILAEDGAEPYHVLYWRDDFDGPL